MTRPHESRSPVGIPGLRALLLVLLGLLVILGVPEEHRPGQPVQVELSTIAESPNAWTDLLARSAEVPIRARISGLPAPLILEPPSRLRAGRPSALGVAWTASDPDPPILTLTGPAGVVDSLKLDSEEGAFLLEPREAGPASWGLAALSTGQELHPVAFGAEVGGWVEEARALRILVLSGPPSSEVRLAIRALEEAGEEVEGWIHLGRDLWVGRGREPGPLPTDGSELAEYDLIMVFPGVEMTGALRDGLEVAVGQRGVGLLLAGGAGTDRATAEWLASRVDAGGLWDGSSPTSEVLPEPGASVVAEDLQWQLPPEIPPLPIRDVTSPLRFPTFPDEGGRTDPLTLHSWGGGRVGILHLTESWRWRMEGDAVDGHRSFWRGMADWLTGGESEDPAMEVLGDDLRVGEAVRVRLLSRDVDRVPVQLRVSGHGASSGYRLPLPVRVGDLHLQELQLAFPEPGVHRLQGMDETDEPLTSGIGVVIREGGVPAPDPEGRLARIAALSPGGTVGVGGLAPDRAPGRWPWPFLLFFVLVGIAAAEWVLRRRAGRP